MFKPFVWMATGGVLVALVLSSGVWQVGDRLVGTLQTLVNRPQPSPSVDVQSLVIQQIQSASDLTTAVYSMQAVVPTRQDAEIAGLVIGTTKLLYVAYGEVRAGVDLSQVTAENVRVEGDRIRLLLPPPRILTSQIDVNRSKVYDYDRGFLNLGPDTAPLLQSQAQQEALQQIVAAACNDGLLGKASDRARLVVSQLLKTAGYQTVQVDSQPAAPTACESTTSVNSQPLESSGNSRQSPSPFVSPAGTGW